MRGFSMITLDGDIAIIEKGKFKLMNYDNHKVYSFYDKSKDINASFQGFQMVDLGILAELVKYAYTSIHCAEKLFVSSDRKQIISQDTGDEGLFKVYGLRCALPVKLLNNYLSGLEICA